MSGLVDDTTGLKLGTGLSTGAGLSFGDGLEGGGTGFTPGSRLLLEDVASFILLEGTTDKILLEPQ